MYNVDNFNRARAQQGYLAKIEVEGKRSFWVFTETGMEFAGLLIKKEEDIVFGADLD